MANEQTYWEWLTDKVNTIERNQKFIIELLTAREGVRQPPPMYGDPVPDPDVPMYKGNAERMRRAGTFISDDVREYTANFVNSQGEIESIPMD